MNVYRLIVKPQLSHHFLPIFFNLILMVSLPCKKQLKFIYVVGSYVKKIIFNPWCFIAFPIEI